MESFLTRARNKTRLEPWLTLSHTLLCVQCAQCGGAWQDTRYFWIQERVQDGDLSIKKVPAAKNCADVWNEASLCFSTTTTLQVCRIGILLTMVSHIPLQDDDVEPMTESVTGLQSRHERRRNVQRNLLHRNRVNIEPDVRAE